MNLVKCGLSHTYGHFITYEESVEQKRVNSQWASEEVAAILVEGRAITAEDKGAVPWAEVQG